MNDPKDDARDDVRDDVKDADASKATDPKPVIATTPTEPTPPQPRTPMHVPDEENELIEKPDADDASSSTPGEAPAKKPGDGRDGGG